MVGKANGTSPKKTIDIFQSDLRPMQYWHTKAQARLEMWKAGIVEGYSTGFRALDTYCRLVDGELIVIAARPSMGKTALGMQIVESIARQIEDNGENGVVAVFSAEMAGWSLYMRMASAMFGVNSYALSVGKGQDGDSGKLDAAMETLRDLPIWIDDNTSPSTAQMLTQLAKLNETIPVRAMMFDFMELGGDKNERSEEQRISTIAKNLKGIAKTLNIPVLALSQLNRSVEQRSNKMPTMADLRYSGMIEQVSDKLMFVMRPEYYVELGMTVDCPIEDERGVAYVQVAKHRNGPRGMVKLAFVKEHAKFANLERERVELNR